jgi:hypothetical protein
MGIQTTLEGRYVVGKVMILCRHSKSFKVANSKPRTLNLEHDVIVFTYHLSSSYVAGSIIVVRN